MRAFQLSCIPRFRLILHPLAVLHVTDHSTSQDGAGGLLLHEELDESLAKCRKHWENRQLPKRYQDVLQAPPDALPLTSPHVPAEGTDVVSVTSLAPTVVLSPSHDSSAMSWVRNFFRTTCNIFGLSQQYHATHFPDHNPYGNLTSDNLEDSPADDSSTHPIDYYPYANESLFLLGEWYWNDGVKKSQSSFQNLIKIVGHPNFRPEDVAGQQWQKINGKLSGDLTDEGDWEDVESREGWIQTPIKIQVPFHKTMLHPGAKEFDTGILHH